ncbi:SLAC1 family transporter [Patulibacter sp. S7RM1-6]
MARATSRQRTTGGRPRVRLLLRELERPADALAHVGPNWFASVMGTGIVANAAALLPRRFPGLHGLALVAWALATAWLVVLVAATAVSWWRAPGAPASAASSRARCAGGRRRGPSAASGGCGRGRRRSARRRARRAGPSGAGSRGRSRRARGPGSARSRSAPRAPRPARA